MQRFLFLTLMSFMIFSCAEKIPDTGNNATDDNADVPEVESISVSPSSLEADGEESMMQFRLTCERAWSIACESDWVLVSPDRGGTASSKKIDVIVFKNITGAQRSATIEITSGEHTKTLALVQNPYVAVTDLNIDKNLLSFDALGSSKNMIVSSPSDFTVSFDAGWLTVKDATGTSVGNTVPAGRNVQLTVSPQANFDGATRTASIVLSASGCADKTVTVSQTGERFLTGYKGLPAVWLLNDTNIIVMRQTFVGPGYVQASRGSAAVMSIHREDVNQKKEVLDYNVASDGGLEMRMLGEGDYFLYSVPVENFAAGTTVHITASYHSDNSANKYFVFEYFDDGQWKMTRDLTPSPEGVSYHYASNGHGLSQAYTPNIDETVTLSKAISSGNLQMRLRCVGNRKFDGGALDFSSNALTRIAAAKTHGTSPIIRLLDGPRPSCKIKVLFIGNSYTYYNWSSYMLKEIAWKEGLEVEVALSAHSGFTIERHLDHAVTTSFVNAGGYDYAIVQEYNDRMAVVGADLAKGSLGSDALKYVTNMKTMISNIKAKSPSVVPLIEISWGTKNGVGSLIKTNWTDYVTMQGYVTEGTKHVATQASVDCTLLGEAWKKVRSERPSLEMYHTDLHHPSYAGSYLKACVNYLTLSGKKFGSDPCDCLLDAETAAYLRGVAESVVLK